MIISLIVTGQTKVPTSEKCHLSMPGLQTNRVKFGHAADKLVRSPKLQPHTIDIHLILIRT